MNCTYQIAAIAAVLLLTVAGCKKEESGQWSRPAGEGPSASATPLTQNSASQPAAGNDGADPHAGMAAGNPHAGMPTGGISAPAGAALEVNGNLITAAGIAAAVHQSWEQEKPSSSARLGQFKLPGSGGPGELAIFYFGQGQGGDTEANVQRWVNQFSDDDENTTTIQSDVARLEQDGLKLALVKTSGTYNPGMMMGAQEPKPDYALFGIVVEGGAQGSVFFKATGPKKTLDEQNANLEAFARSIRKAK